MIDAIIDIVFHFAVRATHKVKGGYRMERARQERNKTPMRHAGWLPWYCRVETWILIIVGLIVGVVVTGK